MTYPSKVENTTNRQETAYSINRSVSHMPGLMQVPSGGGTGADALSIFVRVHAPYEVEVVNWTAICEGGPPDIPSPVDATLLGIGTNRVFLGSNIGAIVPHPVGGPVVKHVFSVAGTYYYGKKKAEGPIADIPLGKYPWEAQGLGDNFIPKENFKDSVLTPDMPTPAIPLLNPIQGP